MADVHSPAQRSYNMSRIRSRDTKPEIMLRRALWAKGLRYRVKSKLPGKPDIVFSKQKVAIFVDGCFWHGCPEHFKLPQTRTQFWKDKIAANVRRDRTVDESLKQDSWCVLRVWEHQLHSDIVNIVDTITRLILPAERIDARTPHVI